MGSLQRSDLETLFASIDAKLEKQINLFIIGGAAAILGYNVQKVTNDIDLETSIDQQFQELFKSEAQKLKLDVMLSFRGGVFYPPEGYRERMIEFKDFPNKKLRVYTLDKYDLAISKIDRGSQKDFDDIESIHSKSAFDLNELIKIFNDEYINVVATGNLREKKMNLLQLIEILFGAEEIGRAHV